MRTRQRIMGSGPNGCFTPRTYQHVNLGVAGIRADDDHDRDVRFVRDPLGDEQLGRDAPARLDLFGDLCGFCGVRDPRRDPGHRPGPGVALDTRVRGTLPTPQYVPAAAPPLPLNV